MKLRLWPMLMVLASIVALAAEEAPPAELLQNLDFYKNMNMVQDPQFLAMATHEKNAAPELTKQSAPAADTSTIHLEENAHASK